MASSHLPGLHLRLRPGNNICGLMVLEELLPDSFETVLVHVFEFVAALSALLLRDVGCFFWGGLLKRIPTIGDCYALHYFNINFI